MLFPPLVGHESQVTIRFSIIRTIIFKRTQQARSLAVFKIDISNVVLWQAAVKGIPCI